MQATTAFTDADYGSLVYELVSVAFATTKGAAGMVAVLSALYPVVTVVLARFVLGERLSAARRIGGGVTLAGAALVAVS